MTFSSHLFNTFNSRSLFHCSGNSYHSWYTARFCPTTRVTANPSVLLSLRKGSKQAGTEQRTADWQLTCGSTETSISPSKHSYTDADSGTGEIILFPEIFKHFWVRGKDKWHNRCLWSLYTPTSESGNIMYQELQNKLLNWGFFWSAIFKHGQFQTMNCCSTVTNSHELQLTSVSKVVFYRSLREDVKTQTAFPLLPLVQLLSAKVRTNS